jgi:HlyD family secretion protein
MEPPDRNHPMRRTSFRKVFWALCASGAVLAGAFSVYFYLVPHAVSGFVARARPALLEIRGPALLDATNKVTATARIQGFLKAIYVDKNDPVIRGQILAEIESEDLAVQLIAAQSDANAAELTVSEARGNLENIRALADKAKSDFDRRRSLLQTGTISQSDWTVSETAFKQTQADLTRAGATIERLLAQTATARANVRLLQIRLNDATIRSPLDGIVVRKNRNVGDLLAPGTLLLEIVDPSTVILTARFDEAVMGMIKPGQRTSARFAAEPRRTFKGSVLRLNRQVDQETREFEVDVVLDELPATWAIGQRSIVTIDAPGPDSTLAIPQDLLARRGGHVGLWTVEDGRSTWVPVTLGHPSGNAIQVLGGLQPGNVVLWPRGRFDFEPVNVVEQRPVAGMGLAQ